MDERKIWGIHTKDDILFLEKCTIALGWEDMGDLSLIDPNREAFKDKYSAVYKDASKQSVSSCVGTLFRFVHEAKIGDYVIYPSKNNREVNIGIIESDYFYNPAESPYAQQRKVRWIKHLPRTAFSQGALNEIGAFLTFFAVKNYADEFLAALDKGFKGKYIAADEDEVVAQTAEEITENTRDFILKELNKHFKGYDFEGFVADLLQAMGYRTEVSPKGGDSGIDIKAYKDELPPRIIVQVKSQDANITESTIQSLKGAMREGDYGLFITLSSYTKNALRYLEHTPIIRGISGIELVDLIIKYYDKLNDKHRKMIPLKQVYIPIVEENYINDMAAKQQN